jgi:hypothetical protein
MIIPYNKYIKKCENNTYDLDDSDHPLFYQLKPTKQIIKEEELTEIIKKNDIENFNRDFTGWVKIKPKYKTYLFNIYKIQILDNNKFEFTFSEYFTGDCYGSGGRSGSTLMVIIQPNIEFQKYVVIEKSNVKSDIDPYDEEDWNWDIF